MPRSRSFRWVKQGVDHLTGAPDPRVYYCSTCPRWLHSQRSAYRHEDWHAQLQAEQVLRGLQQRAAAAAAMGHDASASNDAPGEATVPGNVMG